MKKIKTIALTSIMLSATVLGANISTIDVLAKKSEPIKVKRELRETPKILQVTEDSVTDSNGNKAGIAKYKFSDLKDGETLDVKPIFKSDTYSGRSYEEILENRLGIVDDNGTPLKMKVITRENFSGFINVISYTDNGKTKQFKLNYNYEAPYINNKNGTFFNFKDGQLPKNFMYIIEDGNNGSNLNTPESNIDAFSKNYEDFNGHEDGVTTRISRRANQDIATKGGTVEFTTKDNLYNVPEEKYTRYVYIFRDPDWSSLENRKENVGNDYSISYPTEIKDSNGNVYQVKIDNLNDVNINKPGEYTVNYVATARNGVIDAEEYGTGNEITYKKTMKLTVVKPETEINYTVILIDKKTGNIVYRQSLYATDGTKGQVDTSELPAGYTLTDDQKNFTVDSQNSTKIITVSKTVPYDITYIDKDTNGKVGSNLRGTGEEGSSVALTAPKDYNFASSADMIFTLDSATPSKRIYVTKKSILTQDVNYTIQYKDIDTGKIVDKTTSKGKLGDFINASAPKGYAFAGLNAYGFILSKDNMTFTSNVKRSDTKYNISYIDESTDKEIGKQSGFGMEGAIVNLTAPKGYSFINANDVSYKIDKNNTDVKVYVRKSASLQDTNLITSYPYEGYVKIYDVNGKLNNDVVLSPNSNWVTDQVKTIKGEDYYRVATNEYVKATSVYKYTPVSKVIKTAKVTAVYNSKGQLIIDRALGKNTPWYTDKTAIIRGKKMYRVATDEWVKASEVQN